MSEHARSRGVHVQFEHKIESLSELRDADLIVAADGVSSRLRQFHVDQFNPAIVVGRNKYIWLGTSKVFTSFAFAFTRDRFLGSIWFYGYGFSDDLSTCIVECSPQTWAGLGIDSLREGEGLALLGKIFERELDGHPLMNMSSGNEGASWLNFRTVTNQKWHHDNIVLMGDAAHTTHYSLGGGTTLALEDAIGLAGELRRCKDVQLALDAYERIGSWPSCPRRARRGTAPSGTRTFHAISILNLSSSLHCRDSVTPASSSPPAPDVLRNLPGHRESRHAITKAFGIGWVSVP